MMFGFDPESGSFSDDEHDMKEKNNRQETMDRGLRDLNLFMIQIGVINSTINIAKSLYLSSLYYKYDFLKVKYGKPTNIH